MKPGRVVRWEVWHARELEVHTEVKCAIGRAVYDEVSGDVCLFGIYVATWEAVNRALLGAFYRGAP